MRILVAVLTTSLAAGRPAAAEPPSLTATCGAESPAVAAPDGNELAFALQADGVQIYACASSGGTAGWTLQAPEAQLVEAGGVQAGTHFAGPTWQSMDGSKVKGAKVSAATPDPAAIPWLLLRADSHEGSGRMADVTFVRRIQTTGGNPPATGCDAAHAGAVVRVPYRALYCFYRADAARPPGPRN